MSRKTSTLPTTSPSASRIGAALSSMGRSVPSLAIRTVWFASPTIVPSSSARSAGFSTGWRVSSLTMRNTSSSVPARGLLGLPADELLGDRVEEVDPPLGVGADDGIADARQRDVQPLPLLLDQPGVLLGHSAGGGFFHEAAGVLLGPLPLGQVPGDLREADAGPRPRRCRAVMTTLAQNCEPSLRTRQPSSSNRPSACGDLAVRGRASPGRWPPAGRSVEKCWPMISSALYPLIRSAPAFQVATWPCGSSMKMA